MQRSYNSQTICDWWPNERKEIFCTFSNMFIWNIY